MAGPFGGSDVGRLSRPDHLAAMNTTTRATRSTKSPTVSVSSKAALPIGGVWTDEGFEGRLFPAVSQREKSGEARTAKK